MDKRIGAQYHSLREHIKTIEDFDKTCGKISEMGYKIVQISGCSLDAKDMKEILDKHSLKCVVTHRPLKEFLENIDGVIEYNRILGSEICGLGMPPDEYWESLETVKDLVNKTSKISEEIKKCKMCFGYHNHSLEFSKYDGKTVMDYLLSETDPESYKFIVDTFWVQCGGVDPAKFIDRLGNRAIVVHFKDLKVVPSDYRVPKMADVGEGNLNWDEIIKSCETAGTKWAIVEHDTTEDPFKTFKESYKYLTSKGFN